MAAAQRQGHGPAPAHRQDEPGGLGWLTIARLGLVQAALGAVVVITTSVLNRIMVVELALPALLPGLLVALHYAVQVARPRLGHGADQGRRGTPWIIGGMVVLAAGGWLAALAVTLMGPRPGAGLALAVLAFVLIGLGVGAAGTALLALLAKHVAPARRAPAATVVWVMMIFGFALTAGITGRLLDPYTPARLLAVCAGVCLLAPAVAALALWGVERAALRHPLSAPAATAPAAGRVRFGPALRLVWQDAAARRFTLFVFCSMLAFSAQDLILEPFAGLVHGYSPGQSTSLAGVQHGGVLVGMIAAAVAGAVWAGRAAGSLRWWTVGGCLASALAMAGLVASARAGAGWPLGANVFLLGVANGAFSIAAIGSMMALAGQGGPGREGLRMGLWGAAQALAFALGGLIGAVGSDLARHALGQAAAGYALVFAIEAVLFVLSAALAWQVAVPGASPRPGARSADAPAGAPLGTPAHGGLA